ncbi:diguanylate cyclase [Massilia antarctica]|uniref:diguanylate cyclase n=2 Tax=Massilia antarctica TaxID=2765360 RepID=A0AA49A9Z3_9BURK|nr:ligand-binding sensor domain-containing diguanylate cyclase [Massilia antarctica]QPI51185.1 diguanylate cyclase [Massilia antarctica]
MRWMWSCLLLIGTICPVLPAAAQEMPLRRFQYQSWSTEAGLPQVSVYDVAHDADGYLWVATENGLARFDGTRFTNFNRENTPAMASRWVSKLYRGKSQRLWIATRRNLLRWEAGQFTEQAMTGAAPGRVRDLVEDADGHLWLAGDVLLQERGKSMLPVPGWTGAATALATEGDAVWIAGAHGVLARQSGGQLQRFQFAQLDEAFVGAMVWARGALWLASSKGLFRLRDGVLEAQPLQPGPLPPKLTSMAVDGAGALLLGSDKALFRVREGAPVERLDAGAAGGFAAIISVRTGADGSVWLGSQQHGLRHLWPDRVDRLSTEEGLRDARVWSLAAQADGVLVGHNGGFDRLAGERFTPVADTTALPDPKGYAGFIDTRQRRWLGTFGGLVRIDADGGGRLEVAALAGLQVNGIEESPDGVVWVASSGGLFRIEDDQTILVDARSGLDEQMVRFVLADRDARLWVGTEHGLFRQDGARFVRVQDGGLGATFITSIAQLSDGTMAIGSLDQGMFFRIGGVWRHIERRQGLPVDSASILVQHGDSLLVVHADGVYRFPLSELASATLAGGQLRHIEILLQDHGDRLGYSRVRCCNYGGNGKALVLGDTLLLATLNGVARIDLRERRQIVPRVTIRAIRLARAGASPTSAGMALPLGVRDLDIDFGTIDFRYARLVRYRYRVCGPDADWIDAGQRAAAIYTNLPPGTWRFEVQARYLSQEWGPSARLELTVPPYFGETWLFKIMLLGAAGMLIAVWVKRRERRLIRQKAALKAEVAKRTAELAEANLDLANHIQILAEASVTDALTGLHNRRFMQEHVLHLFAELIRAREDGSVDAILGFILVDIDFFKAVNDRFGHAVGDDVLCAVGQALREAARDSDYVLRWGGEEFLLVVTNSSRAELVNIAERLRLNVARVTTGGADPQPVTVSLGYVAYPLDGIALERHEWSTALAVADKALYGAKESGRNCAATIVFDGADGASWGDDEIRAALEASPMAGATLVVAPRSLA